MPRPQFNADVIGQIQGRANEHNTLAKALGLPLVRMQELKNIYTRGYKRSSPAERAMRKVDEHLAVLRGDEPAAQIEPELAKATPKGETRDGGGKFMSLRMPTSQAEHETLQDGNAGYRAMTSDIVPDHRGEATMSAAVPAASVILSGAAMASIYRGRPNGVVRGASRWASRAAGYGVGAIPTGALLHAAVPAVSFLQRKAGSSRVVTHEGATDAAAAVGKRFGSAAARLSDIVNNRAHRYLHGTIDALASKDVHRAGRQRRKAVLAAGGTKGEALDAAVAAVLRAKLVRGAKRIGVLGVVGVVPGIELGRQFYDTAVGIGRGIDAVNYRTIQKAALNDEGAQALLKSFRDEGQGLAKGEIRVTPRGDIFTSKPLAEMPRLHTVFRADRVGLGGRVLGAGLAAIGGAAVGVGVKHLVHMATRDDGNTYHDAKGHFTSKDKAVHSNLGLGITAALGGGLAATATLLSYKRLNLRAISRVAAQQIERIDANIERLKPDTSHGLGALNGANNHPRLIKKNADRAEFIAKHVEDNVGLKHESETLDEIAKNPEVHFRSRVREEVDNRLTEMLAAHQATSIPAAGGKSKSIEMRSLGELYSGNLGREVLRGRILAFVSKATPETMEAATANLSKTARDGVMKVFRSREHLVNSVSGHLSDHEKAVVSTRKAIAVAEKSEGDLFEESEELRVSAEAVTGKRARNDLEARATAAGLSSKAQSKIKEDLQERLQDMQRLGPQVPHPFFADKTIAPVNAGEVGRLKAGHVRTAREKAEVAYVKSFEELRTRLTNQQHERRVRVLAAHAQLGQANEVFREPTNLAAQDLIDARATHVINEAGLFKLRGDLTKASNGLKVPLTDGERAIAEAHVTTLKIDILKAERLSRASEALYHETATTFEAAVGADKIGQRSAPLLNRVVGQALARDIHISVARSRAAVDRFIAGPSGKALADFATAVGAQAKKVGSGFQAAGARIYQDAATLPDGKGGSGREFSPVRAASSITLAGGVLGAAGGYLEYTRGAFDHHVNGGPAPVLPRHLGHKAVVKVGRDPYTGHVTHTAFVLPDPDQPGQQVVLWGERYKGDNFTPEKISTGANYGEIERRAREDRERRAKEEQDRRNNNQSGGQGGNQTGAKFLSDDVLNNLRNDKDGKRKAALIALRDEVRKQNKQVSEHEIVTTDGSAGEVKFRKGNSGGDAALNAGRNFHSEVAQLLQQSRRPDAMQAVFSHEGRILKVGQAAELLTGYREDKSKLSDKGGALGLDADFIGDPEEVASALRKVIAGQSQSLASNDVVRENMHKAVAVVAYVRRLDEPTRKSLHDAINGEGPKVDDAAAGSETPQAARPEQSRRTEAPSEPKEPRASDYAYAPHDGVPSHWSGADEDSFMEHLGRYMSGTKRAGDLGLASKLELSKPAEKEGLQHVLRNIAFIAHNSFDETPPLTPGEAAHIAKRTLEIGLGEDSTDTNEELYDRQENMRDKMLKGDLSSSVHEDLDQAIEETRLHRAMRAERAARAVKKADLLGDLTKAAGVFRQILLKADAGAGSLAGHVVGEAVDGAAGQATRKGLRNKDEKPQSVLHPVRLAMELATFGGGDAAWQIANKHLPTPKASTRVFHQGNAIKRRIPTAAGIGYGAKVAARHIGSGVAGVAGSVIGSLAASSALHAGYSAAGRKAPGYAPPEYQSGGEQMAEVGGQIAGGWGVPKLLSHFRGGGTLGLGAAIATSALGGYGGATVAREVYRGGESLARHFQGYDKKTVARATRHLKDDRA